MLCIFDIDGTLTESVIQHQTAFLKALLGFGLVCENRNWASYLHHSDSAIFCEIAELEMGRLPIQEELERFDRDMLQLFKQEVALTPLCEVNGARVFLEELALLGIPVAFATGSMRGPAREKLNFLFGDQWQEELLSSASESLTREEIVEGAKERALSYYKVPRFDRIISFGDGVWDLKTAHTLGLEFIGITGGTGKFQGLCGEGQVFPDFGEITAELLSQSFKLSGL